MVENIEVLGKFAAQYGDVIVVGNSDFHDRFIILDDNAVYVLEAR